MKNYPKTFVSLLLFSLFNLPNLQASVPRDTTTKLVTEERKLGNFNAVIADASIDIVITNGSTPLVKVGVPETRILKFVQTTIKDGILTIHLEENNSYNWGYSGVHTGMQAGENPNKISIWLSMPQLKKIQLSGSANVVLAGTFKQPELELNLSGSSGLQGQVQLHLLKGKIDASATLTLKGHADEAKLQVEGSSIFKGAQLKTQDFLISMEGSSIATVQASTAITGKATGNSVLNYMGPLDRKNFPVSTSAAVREAAARP